MRHARRCEKIAACAAACGVSLPSISHYHLLSLARAIQHSHPRAFHPPTHPRFSLLSPLPVYDSLNKLLVFDPVVAPYRKLLWMDADTLVLQNVDSLLTEPMFTGAFTVACCNVNSPAQPSGGLWVVEPSASVTAALNALMNAPVPGTKGLDWHWGDMQLVRFLFGAPPPDGKEQPVFPSVEDGRYGYIPGVREYPEIAAYTETQWIDFVNRAPAEKRHEGLLPGAWDGKSPAHIWHILDATYDQCVGNCECMPGRDMPKKMKTVHYSCMQHMQKPGNFESEHELMSTLNDFATSCSRYWVSLWYEKFIKAAGRLPAPLWDGAAIPIFDKLHDEIVLNNRLKYKK